MRNPLSRPLANLLGVLTWLLLSTALVPTTALARDIVVAQSVDISGPLGYIGKDYMAGAHVYFDYVNANGGVHGQKILHVIADNEGSGAKSAQITKAFLSRQKADVLFGYFGEGSLDEVMQNAEFKSSGIPLVAPLSGIEPRQGTGNVYFVRPSYASEAKKLVGHFLSLGITRFGAAYAQDGYGKAALTAVEEELAGRGMALTGKRAIGQNGESFDAAARAMVATKPQAVIVVLETLPAAQFIKAFRKFDKGTYIFGLSMIDHQILFDLAGRDDAAGIMVSEVVPHPNNWTIPVVAEHSRIMKTYRDEAPTHLTLEGFIAAKMLVAAMKSLERDFTPAQLSAALKEMRSMDIGGYYLAFSPLRNRGSSYVDINVISRKGRLVN